MSTMDRFKRLAGIAREERPPAIDVTDRVMSAIALPGRNRAVDVPLAVLSGLSLLAASVAVAVAIQSWGAVADPMAVFFSPLTGVMP